MKRNLDTGVEVYDDKVKKKQRHTTDEMHAVTNIITKTVHKMLMPRVLSDRYRVTQEKFQYQGV